MTAAELADIHAASFVFPRPWSAAEFTTLLDSPFAILVEGNHGFAMGRVVAGEAELLTIAVRPDARRNGEGRDMLRKLLCEAISRGADRMFLEVAADNTPAILLYESLGFARTGRRKGYYSGPNGATDALTYCSIISPVVSLAPQKL